MKPSESRWRMPLSERPRIITADFSTHGVPLQASSERYCLSCWTLHFYRYRAEVEHRGVRYRIRPGDVGVFPPDAAVIYRYHSRGTHAYCHFTLPVGDLAAQPVLAMQQLGARFNAGMGAMEAIIANVRGHRLRAEVALWDLLLDLCEDIADDGARARVGRVQPLSMRAIAMIEAQLDGEITAADLAAGCGVGRNHLARIFRRDTGSTITAFVRTRRAERAARLLATTDLSLKQIAGEIGVTSAQAFNKLMRSCFGVGPREMRAQGIGQSGQVMDGDADPDAMDKRSPSRGRERRKPLQRRPAAHRALFTARSGPRC